MVTNDIVCPLHLVKSSNIKLLYWKHSWHNQTTSVPITRHKKKKQIKTDFLSWKTAPDEKYHDVSESIHWQQYSKSPKGGTMDIRVQLRLWFLLSMRMVVVKLWYQG